MFSRHESSIVEVSKHVIGVENASLLISKPTKNDWKRTDWKRTKNDSALGHNINVCLKNRIK